MRFVLNPLAQITFSVTCGLMAPGVVQGFGSGLALAGNVQHSQIARGTAAATAARSSVASRSTLGLWAHLFDCLLHILSAIPPISHRIRKCAFIKPQNLSLNMTLS